MTELVEHGQLFIGGELTDPLGKDVIEVISPHTEEVIGRVPHASPADVDRAVAVARKAFDEGPWPRMSLDERIEVVTRIKDGIALRHEEIARVISSENGSPYSWSVLAQALGAMMVWDAAITVARNFPYEERRDGVLGKILVRREPVGVVAAVVPWNVPQFVAAAKLAPALLTGCTVILKPSPESPLDAYLLAEIAKDAGLPDGVLSILPADREVSEYLVGHPGIDKVSFTGSVAAGKRVMEVCARNLTRVTLELGGKSANVVFADADLDRAAAAAPMAVFGNAGQDCCARSRILVERIALDRFVEALTGHVEALRVGDPLDDATEMGPLISGAQREAVASYVPDGAPVAARGSVPDGPGYWFPPTVLAPVSNSDRAAVEEIFGPVVCVIPFDDEADAVAQANDTIYGLSGSVWTRDGAKALRVARALDTGVISINSNTSVRVSTPFGGFKQSGVGRELGPHALDHYTDVKNVFYATEEG